MLSNKTRSFRSILRSTSLYQNGHFIHLVIINILDSERGARDPVVLQ